MSFFNLTNSNYNHAFAQQQNNGFDKELNLLDQSLCVIGISFYNDNTIVINFKPNEFIDPPIYEIIKNKIL